MTKLTVLGGKKSSLPEAYILGGKKGVRSVIGWTRPNTRLSELEKLIKKM